MVLALMMAIPMQAALSKKEVARVNYVLKNLGVNKELQTKLKPMLEAYLQDVDKASATYDARKDKLKSSIKAGTLTNEEANELLRLKWEAAAREVNVKKSYEAKFKTVLTPKKTWRCFDLLNDKQSKVEGKQKVKEEE